MNICDGSIIAFAGRDMVAAAIQLGTLSLPRRGISHVGIIGMVHGEPVLYESTSFPRSPCYRTGQTVSGVQAHRLSEILAQVTDATIWHLPLHRRLYPHEIDRLHTYLDGQLGRPYDLIGAARSGGMLLRIVESAMRGEDKALLFCSELVAAAVNDVGIYPVHNASSYNPNRITRELTRNGIVGEWQKLKS